MYSTSSLQGVWHHIHGCLYQICQCKVQFDQYVTTNIGVLFPYMVSLYNAVTTSCNQSFYKSHQGGNSQLQSSCDQLRFSPVASPSEKLQLDFKTLLPIILKTTETTDNHQKGCCISVHQPPYPCPIHHSIASKKVIPSVFEVSEDDRNGPRA